MLKLVGLWALNSSKNKYSSFYFHCHVDHCFYISKKLENRSKTHFPALRISPNTEFAGNLTIMVSYLMSCKRKVRCPVGKEIEVVTRASVMSRDRVACQRRGNHDLVHPEGPISRDRFLRLQDSCPHHPDPYSPLCHNYRCSDLQSELKDNLKKNSPTIESFSFVIFRLTKFIKVGNFFALRATLSKNLIHNEFYRIFFSIFRSLVFVKNKSNKWLIFNFANSSNFQRIVHVGKKLIAQRLE